MGNEIAILFTNDGHCCFDASGKSFGYAGVASCAASLRRRFGKDRVCLADAGDSLGGGALGLLSQGSVPLELLNSCGYDVYAPGNADFIYGAKRLRVLESTARFSFVCANFVDACGNPFFQPYVVKELGGIRVAFVGALTPYTVNVMSPESYPDSTAGGWGFCQDATGEKLYTAVQQGVDAALRDGAQFVVLLSHLGQSGQVRRWRSDEVVRHTRGIDLVLDGHSHQRYLQRVPNAEQVEVPLMQAGDSLSDIGIVVIDTVSGKVDAGFADRHATCEDREFAKLAEARTKLLNQQLSQKVGEAPCDLRVRKPGESTWWIRHAQTNLGNLVADAFRDALDADIALVPSWIIRDDIQEGPVALGDICKVLPLGHEVVCGMLSGRQVADALEYGCRNWPKACGSFLQVSGLAYRIDPEVCSSVLTDEQDGFVAVGGHRRGVDIQVAGKPLDLEAEYWVAAPSFLLEHGSSGFSMMRSGKVLEERRRSAVDALQEFFRAADTQEISQRYADCHGQDRIKTMGADASGSPTGLSFAVQ